MLLKVKCSSDDAASQKAVERALIDHGIKMVRPKKAEFFDHYRIVAAASSAKTYNLAKKLERESMGEILTSLHPV